ncbi:outer membrane lipid asymmetry maintenance protein MlaD [Trichlorobacter ammonificans]|uniref:Phospholipid/cholesterol/gamma-HCH transport system substrate-binding protein n=1 Tax=Trichlorobacter ammonificans TaxID=2916410 RepID=A0ABN8HKC5_9BACT|nr:outer membrane lipid asymmetry maintenance protein MlaD [Trichlorobacter ammonificans]CAH2032479.1 Phospholipid/cholesterol/gamma-HCH transport system substrate-binding protein [Trichlorobacter ammonificans]
MNTTKLELTVGLFMLVGILCLVYISVKLGKMELIGGNYYRVVAQFDSASGLKNGARVEVAGVEVGSVANIALDRETGDRAEVTLKIRDGVKLGDDVIASVRTSGIIGDKFIKLKPGGSDRLLKDGSKIRETESAIDIEELVSKFIHGKVD